MENFLWTEKYRPSTLADCVLPDELKNTAVKETIAWVGVKHELLEGSFSAVSIPIFVGGFQYFKLLC